MIDKTKRKTLKGIAAVAAGSAVGSMPAFATSSSISHSAAAKSTGTIRQVWPPIAARSPIAVNTGTSAVENRIEVVLTNKSAHPVALTQMTPSHSVLPHGTFDKESEMKNGPRHLAAGESVSVHLERQSSKSESSLKRQRHSACLSVTTDADQFCAVSYIVAT